MAWPIILRWLGGNRWELAEPILVCWRDRTLAIPVGVRTDLASVPWWGRWVVPTSGPYVRAAVAHDYLYFWELPGWTRREADALLRDVAIQDETPKAQAWLIWAAVRIGGRRWSNR